VSALRIGILALRQAQGNVDAEVVRNEGQRLIAELSRELALGVQQIDSKIAGSLKLYFDPQSGHFTERVERLVRKDGDLETVLRQQIGDGESSELARTLARRIGESSPLMRRLDPQDAAGIARSIETSVKEVLDSEQNRILGEFSLDNESGALTRVVAQLGLTNDKLQGNIEKQIKAAVHEFSLDDENSALSRLVRKVEEAKDRITDEFSVDNQGSAINKLNLVLAETRQSIDENLTLDNDKSALARLKKQLTDVLGDIQSKNQEFQQDVSAKLASLVTRHQEEMRSTTHGINFEEEFCVFLQREAQRAGDVFTATGTKPGAIGKCKTGDAIIQIGTEAAAAGERIVFEAKSSKKFGLTDASQEIEEARKNRSASVGVFVFAKDTAPQGLQPFTRIDHDLFVIWDAADPSTDIYLSAAVSVAKALLFRQKAVDNKSQASVLDMERALNALEKQLKGLDQMETWTSTIQANSGKIAGRIVEIRKSASDHIGQLRASLEAFTPED
jgi:dipeptidyl aminopeptidase/acylaminoacyl peptidase